MTDPNLEQKVTAIEVNLSDLKSTVATLADMVQAGHEQAEADRAAMREGFERLERRPFTQKIAAAGAGIEL